MRGQANERMAVTSPAPPASAKRRLCCFGVDLGWGARKSSGELTFCHGKSPFLMGKSTINGHFQKIILKKRELFWIQMDCDPETQTSYDESGFGFSWSYSCFSRGRHESNTVILLEPLPPPPSSMVTGSNPARSLGNLYSAYQNPIKIPSCFQAHVNLSFCSPSPWASSDYMGFNNFCTCQPRCSFLFHSLFVSIPKLCASRVLGLYKAGDAGRDPVPHRTDRS